MAHGSLGSNEDTQDEVEEMADEVCLRGLSFISSFAAAMLSARWPSLEEETLQDGDEAEEADECEEDADPSDAAGHADSSAPSTASKWHQVVKSSSSSERIASNGETRASLSFSPVTKVLTPPPSREPPRGPPGPQLRAGKVVLAELLESLLPSPSYQATIQEAFTLLQQVVKELFGIEAHCRPFGSIAQGSHMQGSDLDLCIVGGSAPSRSWASRGVWSSHKQVEALKKIERKLPMGMSVLEQRYFRTVRVPILTLLYVREGMSIEIDISMGGLDESTEVPKGYIDYLIRRVCAEVPRALPFVLLIKQWAKAQGFIKANKGFLSSLAWTLLTFYHLMQQGEVDPELFARAALAAKEDAAQAALPDLSVDAEELCANMPTGEDLLRFFETTGEFTNWMAWNRGSEGPWGVSLLAPAKPVQGPKADRSPFFLEDPAVVLATGRGDNVARALTVSAWAAILGRCKQVAQEFRQCGTLDIATALWAEGVKERSKGLTRSPKFQPSPPPSPGPKAHSAASPRLKRPLLEVAAEGGLLPKRLFLREPPMWSAVPAERPTEALRAAFPAGT